MINRLLKDEIISSIRESSVVVLTGARQTGKTTLIQAVGSALDIDCQYINLKDPSVQHRLLEPAAYFRRFKSECVILDGISYMPDLLKTVKSLTDEYRYSGKFLVVGSVSPELLSERIMVRSENFVYKRVHPFHMLEKVGFSVVDRIVQSYHWTNPMKEEIKRLLRSDRMILRGGLPRSLLAQSDDISLRWRNKYLRVFLEREIPLHGLYCDFRVLKKLLVMIALLQSLPLNKQYIANFLGISRTTITRYLYYLEGSYLLNRLDAYYTDRKKSLVKSPQLFISDTGLFNILKGMESADIDSFLDQSLDSTTLYDIRREKEASLRNIVINQTRALLSDEWKLWFFRTYDGAWADMVITEYGRPQITACICYSTIPKRGFNMALRHIGTKENYIVTPTVSGLLPATRWRCNLASITFWLYTIQRKVLEGRNY